MYKSFFNNFHLKFYSELSDIVKEFVVLVVTMKEMANSLIMRTNNFRDNRTYYPKSLLELHTMKSLLFSFIIYNSVVLVF